MSIYTLCAPLRHRRWTYTGTDRCRHDADWLDSQPLPVSASAPTFLCLSRYKVSASAHSRPPAACQQATRCRCVYVSNTHARTHQTWNWVIGSPGQWVIEVIFHVRVTESSFWPGVRPEFFRFSKKAQDKDIYFCENPSNRHWNVDI